MSTMNNTEKIIWKRVKKHGIVITKDNGNTNNNSNNNNKSSNEKVTSLQVVFSARCSDGVILVADRKVT